MTLDSQAFGAFWTDLESVADSACRALLERAADDLPGLTSDLHSACPELRQRTMSFAQELLEATAKISVSYHDGHEETAPDWFQEYMNCYRSKSFGNGDILSRVDEVLMEQLTGVWLLMYFLSVPMGHTWERVRRLADEQGGYPSGACVTKLIGDVYRESRLNQQNDRNPPDGAHSVLVLSAHPSLLIKDLLTRTDRDKLTPGSLHRLGRCYSLFQLRLYIAQRRPIRYIVTWPTLKRCWALLANKLPDMKELAAAKLVAGWLATVFPGPPHEHQSVELLGRQDEFEMTPCVLGNETGVYAIETGASGTRFIGNRVNKRLLKSLRHQLVHAPVGGVKLIGLAPEALNRVLQQMLGADAGPSTP
jgi:hypothetical protein